mgnify:CR=1 FL=1
MAVLTKMPNTPINEIDVRDTLNANGGNTNDQWSNLCGAAGKAKYTSRHKPVAYNVNACQDYDPDGANYLQRWWRAFIPGDSYKSGRCGVNFPTYTSTASLQGVADPSTLWGHDYPDGGTSQPYRITDFAGYDPKARGLLAPVYLGPSGDVVIDNSGYRSLLLVSFNNNLGTSALDYTEIGYQAQYQQRLHNFYLGVIAISVEGNVRYHGVVSLPYTMAELNDISEDEYYAQDDHSAFVPLNGGIFSYPREYDLYPVLFFGAQDAKKQDGAITCDYIPLPVAPVRVNVVNAPTTYVTAVPHAITVVSSSEQMGSTIKVTVRVTNANLGVSYTFNGDNANNYIEAGIARYYEAPEGEGEYNFVRQTSAFTVPAGSYVDVDITVSNSQVLPSHGYVLVGTKMKIGDKVIENSGYPFKL